MTSTAQWRRVVVVDGGLRHDVSLSTAAPVAQSLHSQGIDMYSRAVLVVGSDGAQVDVSALPALADGALLTVIDITAAPPKAAGEIVAVPRTLDYSGALFTAIAIVAVLAVVVSASAPLPVPGDWAAVALRCSAAVVLGALAVVAALATTAHRTVLRASALCAPGAIAFAAGFLAVPPELAASAHLALFTALLAAAVAQSLVYLRHAATPVSGAAGLVTIVLTTMAAVWGVTLALGLSAVVAAALVAGAAPVALRVLPALCLDIPDGQLLEYGTFMSGRWTVRGSIPEESVPVTTREMKGTITRAQLQLRTGTVVFSVLPALMLPAVLVTRSADTVVTVATLVLVAALVTALALAPRQANGPLLRWLPRIGAALVAAEFVLLAPVALLGSFATLTPIVVTVLIALALVVAAVTVPLARGFRSLGWSRSADIAESLALVLAFPAAFAAAGLIDILRGAVS